MKKLIKKLLGITALETKIKFLGGRLDSHREFVSAKVAELKEYTRVDADVGFRGNNTIILTGVFRNKAYVQFYDLGDGEFRSLVEHLRDMKKHALVRHIDAPRYFKGTFDL